MTTISTVQNPHYGSSERARLQALPLKQFVREAHDLSARVPGRFPTPQHAWAHLRSVIAPDAWDVQHEVDEAGQSVHVARLAGEPIAYAPVNTTSYHRMCVLLREHFDHLYPACLLRLYAVSTGHEIVIGGRS